MRPTIAGAALILLLCGGSSSITVSDAANPPEVKVNGEKLIFADTQPYIDKRTGRTMVPAREIAEKLGIGVTWSRSPQQVAFRHEELHAVLTIGEHEAAVNGGPARLDAPAVVKQGRTMVPLRFVSEVLGADVRWVEERHLALVTSSDKAGRATWIWDSGLIETDPEGLLRFAAEQKLTAIYIRYDAHRTDPEAYRIFIRSAGDLGIRVEALAGASDWIYERNYRHIRRFIAAVAEYNRSAEPAERFSGYHFDIEPYTLDIWKKQPEWVLERWMDAVRLIETEVKGEGDGMTMAFDIPFWIHRYPVPGTDYSFSAWLLEKADGVVIMAYRQTALGSNGIVAIAKPIILEATTLKKQVVVAVDTLPSKEGDHTTFHTVNPADMEAELQSVMEQLASYPGYSGVAVHDYARWRELFHTAIDR